MSPNVGGWGVELRISANEFSCAHGAQINLGDLTPCLTYGNTNLEEQTVCHDRQLKGLMPCLPLCNAGGYKELSSIFADQ